MSRFFKSAAFPILIVIVLAFFASKLIQSGNEAPRTTYSKFLQQIDASEIDSVVLRTLQARKPASLEVCALLTKPSRRTVDLPVRYTGFEIPDKFAIGYGLDYAERYRNLPYVAALVLTDD